MKTKTLIPVRLTPRHYVCLSIAGNSVTAYNVDPVAGTCGCPSFRHRGPLCKHQRAVSERKALPADLLPVFFS